MLLPGTRASSPFADGALSPQRSTPDIPPCVTFDESLLEEGEPLAAGELQLNELTVESVQHTCVGPGAGLGEGRGQRMPPPQSCGPPGLLGCAAVHPRGPALTRPFLWAQADLSDR